MKLRHTAIVVKDMSRMLEFYKSKGFRVIDDHTEQVRIAKLEDNNGGKLELIKYASQSDSNLRKLGISHIAFTIDPEENPIEEVKCLGA